MFAKIPIFDGHNIKFNNKPTRWLGIWLDNWLTFITHINKRLKKPHISETRIRRLTKSYGLFLGLVQNTEIATVSTITVIRVKIWWCRKHI